MISSAHAFSHLLALGGEGRKHRSIPRSGDGNGGGIGGCGGGVVEVRWTGRRVVHFPRQLHGELVAATSGASRMKIDCNELELHDDSSGVNI